MNKGQLITYKKHFTVQTNPATSIFPKLWMDVSEWVKEGSIVVAKGKVDQERGDPKVLVDKITDNIERVKVVSNIPAKEEKEA